MVACVGKNGNIMFTRRRNKDFQISMIKERKTSKYEI